MAIRRGCTQPQFGTKQDHVTAFLKIRGPEYETRPKGPISLKKNTSGWYTKIFVIGPNEGGARGLDLIELFLLNIYMLYSGFSDYMLRGWGRIDPPVKVGGCGGAFWTTRTLPVDNMHLHALPSLLSSLL